MNASTLSIRYNLQRHVFQSSINLQLPASGITAIFGPSGSGKTTLLRCIAGLERVAGAHVQFKQLTFQDKQRFMPVHKRPLGYVFQHSELFLHLTVADNLNYGYKRTPIHLRKIVYDEAVQLLGLSDFLGRKPGQLSGGQRQRVGIARALLTSPQLLLMDEPLASLDHASKADILPYLENLHQELDIPILYVSHSVEEVVRIADRIVLMDDGDIIASGPINELLTDPALPLSHLEEACVVTEGSVVGHQPEFNLTLLNTALGTLIISQRDLSVGQPVRIKIMARDVSIALDFAERTSISNIIPVTVASFSDAPDPAQIMITLSANGTTMLSRITRRSLHRLKLEPGQIVYAQIKSVSLMRDLPILK